MALVLADRVKETTTTTGTGTVTLAGAVTGFQSFSAIGDANTTYYTIAGQTTSEWEVGIGTYTSSGTTLSRAIVLSSSNSGSLVNFSAGTKDVFVTYPSSRSVYADGTTLTATNNAILPVASGGTGVTTSTGTGSNVLSDSPTLVTPNLGTPSALVGTNITGTAAGLTAGNVTTNANLTGAVTSVGNATSLGSFSSANLAGALTDETGSGSAVFATSPTFVTPVLGTPTSGDLTSCTADGTNAVGFRTIPQNSQSAAYTLVLADSGKHIFHPVGDNNARTFTIPANSSVAYPIGTAITFINMAVANVTIDITSDTLVLSPAGTTGSRTLATNGSATCIKITSTEWLISGSGLT
jgi:hypothetical protein